MCACVHVGFRGVNKLMNYPGGKNRVYQTIINQMPQHQCYIEPFLGSGAVMRMKRPAELNIGLDLDNEQLQVVRSAIVRPDGTTWLFFNRNSLDWLSENTLDNDCLVYLDPPYLMSSRSSQRQLYRYELSDNDHIDLLSIVTKLRCYVIISGYWSDLYADWLDDWRHITFQTMTRGGTLATEYLWMNFTEPTELHDYQYLGDDFRERERIKRKKKRWVNKLKGLDTLERQAILWAIQESGIANSDDTAGSIGTNGDVIRYPSLETTMEAITAKNDDNGSRIASNDDAAAPPKMTVGPHLGTIAKDNEDIE